ncbi:L,D-transpeptidase catalytic domain cotaining protein [Terrimicrobium sacchariphilum]|jgi:lipoprotein-anchoring transpeptidase ErfK/SrfK|uniref:L,D-transpeptidase catalytic domain cotaining protein n=1 Tax=Terrimicrobium sacchariphilum TaxID=690879 RepID=A0A146G7Q4_TERSA|nr:L,D-transpeptidase [Terrimicrobium sacchariphilum]GAT33531.1 L,D-transpeptidase catalytic domain cotaining protein [Terrimicrobium sacchariphilum]
MNEPDQKVHATLSLLVNVPRQTLELHEDGRLLRQFPISTSRFGLGSEPGSFKTPLGKFAVSEKHGAGAPLGAHFVSRQFTGNIAAPGGEEDLVLTRILWLEGLEPGNANTKDRYIYIHGTNQEQLIGTPASHGCVRMKNADIQELYDLIPEGTPVEIVA